jgi:hypothetical protein
MNPRYLLLDGKAYVWRELLKMRREQLRAIITARQLTLFELREDVRPGFHRTAAGRYLQPSLFTSDATD